MKVRTTIIKCIFIVLALSIIMVVGGAGMGSAVECNASIGSDPCTVTNRVLILNPATYYLNGTNQYYVIAMGGNATLDCNGSILIGNKSAGLGNFAAIAHQGTIRDNVTIQNCTINNYHNGILATGNNWTIRGNNFFNISSSGSGINGNNTFIYNNNYNYSGYGTYIYGSGTSWGKFAWVYDNNYYNITNTAIYSARHNTSIYSNNIKRAFIAIGIIDIATGYVYNNNIENSTSTINNCTDIYYYNNNFTKSMTTAPLQLARYSKRINIYNNYFNTFDIAISLTNSSYIYIENNTFLNATTYYDGYNSGILLYKQPNNIFIIGNNFTQYGSNGIVALSTINLTIKDNYFNPFSIGEKITNNIRDGLGIPSAIAVVDVYKTWVSDSTENSSQNYTNKVFLYNNTDINITNNIFSDNVVTRLYSQGTFNLKSDVTGYYTSFRYPYLMGRSELWINPSFTNVSLSEPAGTYNLNVSWGWMNNIYARSRFTNTYEYYVLSSTNTNYSLIQLYNKTSALISLSNGTGYLCTSNCNITLTPNNYTYVLDDFNLTEGVTRVNSPITYQTLSSGQFKITNTLSNTLTFNTYYSGYRDIDYSDGTTASYIQSGPITLDAGEYAVFSVTGSASGVCDQIYLSYGTFFNNSGTILLILGTVIIIGAFVAIVVYIKDFGTDSLPDISVEDINLKIVGAAVVGLLILALIAVVVIVGVDAACKIPI